MNFEFEFEKIIFEKVFENRELLNPSEFRLVDIEYEIIGDRLNDLEIINCDKEIFIKKNENFTKTLFQFFFFNLIIFWLKKLTKENVLY